MLDDLCCCASRFVRFAVPSDGDRTPRAAERLRIDQGLIKMLVKVRNDDPSRLSSTERTVVNWLKSWTGAHALSGIAVVKAHGADLIVWTPTTCVVVVVKGFTERMNGALHAADTGPWTVDGHIAPLEGVQDGTEPMAEVRARTAEIAQLLRGAPGREHVAVMGIVLVIPQLGTRVSLEKGHLPEGLDVVVGDGPSSLRAYFTRIAGGGDETGAATAGSGDPATWDAAQVSQALGALGFAAAATYSDLTAEGFPPPRGDRATSHPAEPSAPAPAVAPIPPVTSVPPGAPPATPPGSGAPIPPPPGGPAPITVPGAAAAPRPQARRESAPPSSGYAQPAASYRDPQRESSSAASGYASPPRQFGSTPSDYGSSQRPYASATPSYGSAPQSYSSPAQPYSVPFEPRPPKPMRPRGRGFVPLVLLALLVLVLAVAAFCTAGSDEPTSPAPAPLTTTTTIPHTTTPDPTVPPETPGPACFPLQPDCPAE
ncbi:hypothetical protein [Nocardia wallacei]|uniref:hypothetical protein n=1 Tax=Nocardia wallacei TaxID=480035 RepID=UPI0024572CE6|nr:hypothetical protein [Nocardia wallacei]